MPIYPDFLHVLTFDALPSTHDYLKENYPALEDSFPVMVNARFQTKGRGRDGRSWASAKDLGVYATFGIHISDPRLLPFLAVAAGLAVAEALNGFSGLDFVLKWPNDILIHGKKIAGILIENIIVGKKVVSLVGIGVNVNHQPDDFPCELAERAISLRMATGGICPVDEIRIRLARCLFQWLDRLEKGETDVVIDRANRLSRWLLGRVISFHDGNREVTGIYAGMDPGGGAILEREAGVRALFFSGEIVESRGEASGDRYRDETVDEHPLIR